MSKTKLNNDYIVEILKRQYAEAIIDTYQNFGDLTIIVEKQHILHVCQFIKEHSELQFNFLMDLTCVDYLGKENRFEVVYHLYSLKNRKKMRLKITVGEEDLEVQSLVTIWEGANWYEREAWDMFGIKFKGHPDLKRILMYEGFDGHPLRKDYPYKKRQPLVGPVN